MAHLKEYLGSISQNTQARNDQVKNHAGGYVFQTSSEQFAKRFLIMGAEATLYRPQSKIAVDALKNVLDLAITDPQKLANLAREVSVSGKAIKNDYAIIALAILWMSGEKGRNAAEEVFFDVIRIPTHLFMFLEYLKQCYGKVKTGRRLRKLIEKFYNRDENTVIYHMLKYQSREGWSHKDVLRIGHPHVSNEEVRKLISYILEKPSDLPEHPLFQGFYKLRNEAKTPKEVVKLIEQYNLTWEFVPSQFLGYKEVWETLLPNLPTTALIRNLGRLTALEVLKPLSKETEYVVNTLTQKDLPKKAKIHPLQAVIAQRVYDSKGGVKGSLSWEPVPAISNALEELVWDAFDSLEPTGKKYYVAVDVSSSMWWRKSIQGVLTPGEVAGILALSLVKAEGLSNVHTAAFSTRMQAFTIGKYSSLKELFTMLENLDWGGTDCSAPMLDATSKKLDVDTFLILTDNETWYGNTHPYQALQKYRNVSGNDQARLAVCALETTGFTIADPNDPLTLDIAGFDPSLPRIVQEFALL